MQTIFQFLSNHASEAHYWIFGMLILAGFNLPISEDLLIIVSAILASTVVPQNLLPLFFFAFLGCYLSDLIVYNIGRSLRDRVWKWNWFCKIFSLKNLRRAENLTKKYGPFTLFVGRFIPFGVRNALFFMSGVSKMPFHLFAISDLFACLLSNSFLFFLTYSLKKNYVLIFPLLKKAHLIIFAAFIVTIIVLICYYWKKKKT